MANILASSLPEYREFFLRHGENLPFLQSHSCYTAVSPVPLGGFHCES